MRIFVAGATGYIGSRLVPRLVAGGHDVVVLTRDARRVAARPWADDVEVVVGDATDSRTVTGAMFGVDTVVHLVHAMQEGVRDFADEELRSARTVAGAAQLAGVGHITYVGGLVPHGAGSDELSPHLASRVATGDALADAGPPTTELRASIVLGAGSASFELIRFVAQAPFPVVVHPSWAIGRCQPVAISDLLDVLVAVVEDGPDGQHRILEVGGPEVGRYHDLIDLVRHLRGVSPPVSAPVPTLLPPLVTSQLLATLTPIEPGTVAPLVASLAHDSVTSTVAAGLADDGVGTSAHAAPTVVITPTGVTDALEAALARRGEYDVMPGDPPWVGATLDMSLLAQVVARLPGLPSRLLPHVGRDRVLQRVVDAVNVVRGS